MKLIRLRYLAAFLTILAAVALVAEWRKGCSAAEERPATTGWTETKVLRLGGLKVSLSKPVLVGRGKGHFWFPLIERLPNGEVIAMVGTEADKARGQEEMEAYTGAILWSADGGLTWSQPKPGVGGRGLFLPSGDLLDVPFQLYLRPNGGMGAPYHVIPKGTREIKRVESGVTFTGFPYFLVPEYPSVCTFWVDGQIVKLRNGKYLAGVYGYYKDFPQQTLKSSGKGWYLATTPDGGYKRKKLGLALAESRDGIRWERRATIADENCPLKGEEGPCEDAICRLKDGRLMCLFRMGSGVPYGQTWSSDEGKTWTTPIAASGPFSVEPSVVVMKDGTVIVAGGRPGIHLWFNTDGSGKDWQEIDTREHHNAFQPEDPITDGWKNTTAYTALVAVDDTHLLYIYDRIAKGWDPVPKDSSETNSIWVMRITVRRATP